jgi:threonine 3-dehydrogenase
MKAVMKVEPKPGIVLKDIAVPKAKKREIIVAVKAASICGSDKHLYLWDRQTTRWKSPLPMIIGHEFSGEVIEVGENVTTLQVGDRIAVESHIPCENCYLCKTGRMHICKDMLIYGIQTPHGAFTEYAVVPESIAFKISPNISYEEAALLEPFGVAMHAIERAQIMVGDTVVVIGCGPIGLFTQQLARLSGATPLIVSELSKTRLDLARKQKVADIVIDAGQEDLVAKVMDITKGRGADVVIEAAGTNVTVSQALQVLGKNGTCVLMGLPAKTTEVETTSQITYKEANVLGTTGRLMFQTWDRMAKVVANKRVDLKQVVTHQLPLEKVEHGFQMIFEGKAGKIILLP